MDARFSGSDARFCYSCRFFTVKWCDRSFQRSICGHGYNKHM
jgi:hypothetical protein